MSKADPHCHTDASDGMVTPAELVDAAVKAGLDLIAVTDHDTMASVKEAQARGEAVGLTVVAGQEVTTRWPAQTHVMGWFLKEPVERGMSLEVTDRDRPIARIVPLAKEPAPVRLIPPRRSFALLRRKRYGRAAWAVSSLELLREERRDR